MGKAKLMVKFCGAMGVSLALFIGCADKTPAQEKKAKLTNVRAQFKDSMKSSLENVVTEAKTSSNQALSSALSTIQGLLGHSDSGNPFDGIDSKFLNGLIDKVFESDLVKAIFADENISSRSDHEVVFALKPALCTKLATLSAGNNDLMIKACEDFLTKNAMEFHATKLDDGTLNLGLWHDNKFILSLGASANSIGTRANLGNAKSLIESFMSLVPQDPTTTLPLAALKKLEGALSLQLRFKSEASASGCKDDATLCVMLNIDEDLNVSIGDKDNTTLAFSKSPADNPTLTIAATNEGAFKGTFNLGALDFKSMEGGLLNSAPFHVSLESAAFSLTLPSMKGSEGFVVLLENFKAGKNPSFFEGFGKKVMLDLTNDSRMIEKVKVAIKASKALIDLSSFGLLVSMSDESNDQCKLFESLKLATSKSESTQLHFTGMPGAHFSGRDHLAKDMCNESSLLAFPFWSMLRVASGSACELPMAIAVNQGSVEMTYMYNINGAGDKTATLAASKDQCLRI